jgi:trans-2,3-dihydro-3-hydroxyanthranilate isomerase
MGFDFALVDVFTDRPFGGNQLAVFPDASGIADATMQQLAREFNFSETTFVLPPADPSRTCRVRIFTPGRELPFAGHPTVGTAAVLASLAGPDEGEVGQRSFVFEEGIGPVAVTIDGPTIRFTLRDPDYETSDEAPPADAIARALTLPDDAVAESWYGGVGLRFCFVRLADNRLLDRVALDKAAWSAGIAGGWSPDLYVFAGDYRDGGLLQARFFAPGVGVEEDPATGSACASVVAGLAMRSPEPGGLFSLRIEQGVAMGRPSELEGSARKQDGRLAEVTVGGRATIVGHGTITIPAG